MFDSPFQIAFFVISLLGAIITVACFTPQGIKTLITRDTSGLSFWFFFIAIISSFFWLTIGSMTIAAPWVEQSVSNDRIASAVSGGLPSILTNIITLFINTTILWIKLHNMRQAKNLNISEAEYCYKISSHKNKMKKPKKYFQKI